MCMAIAMKLSLLRFLLCLTVLWLNLVWWDISIELYFNNGRRKMLHFCQISIGQWHIQYGCNFKSATNFVIMILQEIRWGQLQPCVQVQLHIQGINSKPEYFHFWSIIGSNWQWNFYYTYGVWWFPNWSEFSSLQQTRYYSWNSNYSTCWRL